IPSASPANQRGEALRLSSKRLPVLPKRPNQPARMAEIASSEHQPGQRVAPVVRDIHRTAGEDVAVAREQLPARTAARERDTLPDEEEKAIAPSLPGFGIGPWGHGPAR